MLRFLIHDLRIAENTLLRNCRCAGGSNRKDNNNKTNNNTYTGTEQVHAVLLDLLKDKEVTVRSVLRLLKQRDVHDRAAYALLRCNEPTRNLPEFGALFTTFPSFTWEKTYDKHPYYTWHECRTRVSELVHTHRLDLYTTRNVEATLRTYDERVPPQVLERF